MPYQRKEPHLQGDQRPSEYAPHPTWSSQRHERPKPAFHWTMLIDTPQKLIAIMAVILFAFGTGLYMLLTPSTAVQGVANIPLIQPSEGPIKVLPENPGGIQVPHQDKMIYDRLEGQGASDERAQLTTEEDSYPPLETTQPIEAAPVAAPAQPPVAAAPQEAPYEGWPKASPPHLAAKLKQAQPSVSLPTQPQLTAQTQAPQAPAAPLPPVEAQIPAQAPENIIPAGDAIAQLLEQEPPHVASAPVAPAPAVTAPQAIATAPHTHEAAAPAKVTGPISQHYRIHMASLPNKAAAEAEMKRLWSRNKDILGTYKGAITRIESEKGTFYKVIAGPMDSGDAASAVCKKLSHHKTACFVMKPQP